MENITEVNARYIFADGERMKSSTAELIKVQTIAEHRYRLFNEMYSEIVKIAGEYKADIDKMPFHTEAEIKSLRNCIAAIPLERENECYMESVYKWSGMCMIADRALKNMNHWLNIRTQAIRALNEWEGSKTHE